MTYHKRLFYLIYDHIEKLDEPIIPDYYLEFFDKALQHNDEKLLSNLTSTIYNFSKRQKCSWLLDDLLTDEENSNIIRKFSHLEKYKDLLAELNTIDSIKRKKESDKGEDKWFDKHVNRLTGAEQIKFSMRESESISTCACCHPYLLTCEEIQMFPLEKSTEYIIKTFNIALKEKLPHKKRFVIRHLLDNLLDQNFDLDLIFELWLIAEKNGVAYGGHWAFDMAVNKHILLSKEYIKKLSDLFNFKNETHDNFIDDYVRLLINEEMYDLACYFSAKITNPINRLYDISLALLNDEGNEEKKIKLFLKVYQAIHHEKKIKE